MGAEGTKYISCRYLAVSIDRGPIPGSLCEVSYHIGSILGAPDFGNSGLDPLDSMFRPSPAEHTKRSLEVRGGVSAVRHKPGCLAVLFK